MRFTDRQRETLFAAILIDDDVDPQTELPVAVQRRYAPELLADCFGLCRELWRSGFDRREMIELVGKLIRTRDLDAADRLRFKYVRAKFKHLRYAFKLYGKGEGYPPVFDRLTITMGHLQDAYRNRRPVAVLHHALLLRLLLSRPVQRWLSRETRHVELAGAESFRAMLERDRAHLQASLAYDQFTGAELHAMRKIIGREVSFYDTLRTLTPSPDAFRMSRSLSAINGLMGELHDDLVRQKASGGHDYNRTPFPLPAPIRERVTALVDVPFE